MIERAKKNISRSGVDPRLIRLIQGDVEDPSLYEEESYDNVICIKSFAFFPNPVKVVRNVYKSLKLGGRFIIIYANNDSLYAKIKKPKSDLMRFYSFRDMEILLSPFFRIIYKKRIANLPGFIYRYFPRVALSNFIKGIDSRLSIGTMSVIVAVKVKV
jgi:ubiquinone/menaquinone biosynthesis C-methylase UbiE